MRKTLAMRLTAIVILTATLHCTAAGYTQNNITLKETNAPLEKLLISIRKQSGYAIVYTKQMLQQSSLVTVDLQKVSLTEALDACLSRQPLEYTIVNKTIVLKAKAANLKTQIDPPGEITGRITNEQGEPLAGASVIIKRTGKGDIADANGNFKLKNANADDVVEISFTGYKTNTFKIGGASVLALTLNVAVDELDRAVVQAYGKTTQRLATGNIAKVTAAEIERQPVMNPLLALQGKVAGLEVTQTSGFASAPIKVELRGRSALNNNFTSDPLYIVDGVPLSVLEIGGTTQYSSGSSGFLQNGDNGPARGQSPLFSINPTDIESIEILKDADATAIYGSRGANGVILITTKKGTSGKTKFDLSITQGISRVTRFWDMLNTQQYLEMRKEAFANDVRTPTSGNAYDILLWDSTRYTDWQREIYGGEGKATNIQTAISGGNSYTNFRIGAGYNHSTNILTVEGADQRASLSTSISHSSINQKFKIGLSTHYSYSKSNMINLPGKITYAPNAPAIYDSVGNLNFDGWGGITNNSNARRAYPFANLKRPYTSITNFLNANLTVSYFLFKNLAVTTNLGYNNAQANQESFEPISSKDPRNNPTGSSKFGYNNNKNWLVEPQLSYDVNIGKGKLNLLLGSTIQQTNTDGVIVSGDDYTSDALLGSIASAPVKGGSDRHGIYKYAAVFGRVNYNLLNRYIVNLTGRRDGSSRFGDDKHFGNFGAAAAAWIFTEENWLQNRIRFLSFGKLRSSYGLTGSDGVGDYGYITRWSSDNTVLYDGNSVLIPIQHANPAFHWQTTKKLEAALDLGFFRNRLNLSVAWYRNRCGDQLVDFPTPALTGFTSVIANSPALVENSGWEFSANAQVVNSRKFSWSVSFNTAINHNKLVAYPNIELSPYYDQYIIGKPLNIVKVLHYTGVDPQTGLFTFEDKDKDGQVTRRYNGQPDDRYARQIAPGFFGGLGMNFRYKQLQLSLLFNIKKQVGLNSYQISTNAGTLNNNQPVAVTERWQNQGENTSVARYTTTGGNSYIDFQVSDGLYTDASFIRLSNLSASYSFPDRWMEKAFMEGCNIFFRTNNLFLITKYKGIDPETQGFGQLPPAKTIVAGINFNF